MEKAPFFEEINSCPICRSGKIKDYLSMSYTSDSIKKYLFSFYGLEKKWIEEKYNNVFNLLGSNSPPLAA